MIARSRRHRGFVMLAVMVVVGGALLIAASLLFVIQADAAGAAGTLQAEQSRSLAWSGVQVVMSELDDQRETILDSERPTLDDEYVLYEAGRELGVARLLPIAPDGELLVSEAGKLDLNVIDADALEATGLVDATLAQAIIDYRESLGRPFQSVAELLQVEGVTPDLLYGPIEDIKLIDDANFIAAPLDERYAASVGAGDVRGLADVVTVFAFEPNLQRNGKLRINLNVPWSEDLGRRIADRFDEEGASVVRAVLRQGGAFDSESRIFEIMNNANVEPEEWPEYVDAFTAEDHDYRKGLLDINTAPYEALLGLPGLDPDQAAEIVNAREGLTREDRWSIAWPAIEGVVEPEQYNEFGDRLTTRSWTWRVRIAAGTVDAEDPDAELRHPVIYEAVIDLSSPRPRLAYLRDITMLETAATIALNADLAEPEFDRREPETDDQYGTLATTDDIGTAEDFGLGSGDFADDDTAGSGFDLGDEDDLDFGGAAARPREPVEESDGARSDPAPGDAAGTGEASGPPPRRVGRWKPGD